ncbi:methyltransferase [Streptomyces sp. NPDC021096]|uniref:methyltransferase n=1 Tax=Streptomyces sp. NPDC021096 TaxID=3154792 RepID=UPI0033F79519
MLDIGGCPGNLVSPLLLRFPHLRAAVYDLAPLADAFAGRTERLGMAGRAAFHGGDFVADEPLSVTAGGPAQRCAAPLQRRPGRGAGGPGADPWSASTRCWSPRAARSTPPPRVPAVDVRRGLQEVPTWPLGHTNTLIIGCR